MIIHLFRALRPRQWAKNVLVFAALVFDNKLLEPVYFNRVLIVFAIMCALASAVYLINDLADIEKDRQHPTKKNRPLASGALSPWVAVVTAAVLLAASLPAAFVLDFWVGVLAVFYIVKNLAYSFWLKRVVIIDVMLLAVNYLVRVGIGVAVVNVERFSPWLYVCVGLGALFIGLGKRRHELELLADEAINHRDVLADYTLPFIDLMIGIVTTSTVVAYSFYTFSDAPNLPPNHTMMLTIPIVLYAIFRYLYLVHVRNKGGAPDELIFKDKPLFSSVVVWGISVVYLIYFSP